MWQIPKIWQRCVSIECQRDFIQIERRQVAAGCHRQNTGSVEVYRASAIEGRCLGGCGYQCRAGSDNQITHIRKPDSTYVQICACSDREAFCINGQRQLIGCHGQARYRTIEFEL